MKRSAERSLTADGEMRKRTEKEKGIFFQPESAAGERIQPTCIAGSGAYAGAEHRCAAKKWTIIHGNELAKS